MPTDPENALETALKLALQDATQTSEFFRVLLESNVHVLGDTQDNVHLELINWQKPDGTKTIPFFSSVEVLTQSVETSQTYLTLNARTLFTTTAGASLILNPKSAEAKEFSPELIERLIALPPAPVVAPAPTMPPSTPAEKPSMLGKLGAKLRPLLGKGTANTG